MKELDIMENNNVLLSGNEVAKEVSRLEVILNASVNEDMDKLSKMTNIKRANLYSHAGYMDISLPASEGISNQLSTEESAFIQDKGSIGWELSPFPYKKSKFQSIVNSLRNKLRSLCFGNSDLISEDKFKEFLEFYNSKMQEWEDEKEYLISIYDSTISHFKENMNTILDKSHPSIKEEVMREVIRKTSIPAETFFDSFEIGLRTEFDEKEMEWKDTEDKLRDTLTSLNRNAIVSSYNDIVKGFLQEYWRTLIMYVYQTCIIGSEATDKVSQGRAKSFREKISTMRAENVLGDVRFDKLLDEFFDLSKIESKMELKEYALDTFAVMYKLGVDTNNILPFKINLNKSASQKGNKFVEFPYEDFTPSDLLEHFEDLIEAQNS